MNTFTDESKNGCKHIPSDELRPDLFEGCSDPFCGCEDEESEWTEK